MATLVQCPQCWVLRSLKTVTCPKCGLDLKNARKQKKVKYAATLYYSSVNKRKTEYFMSLKDAQQAERDHQQSKSEHTTDAALYLSDKVTVEGLMGWFLNLKRMQNTARYKHGVYFAHRKIIKEAIGPYQVTKLTVTTLEDFLTDLSEKKYKSNYIDSVLKTLKQAVKKGVDDDQIPIGALRPFQKVKSPMAGKNSDARSRIVTAGEFDKLYENALPHHKPLLATLYWTGMRPGEVLNLVWAQVNLPRRQIILEGGDTKTEDPRIIPIVSPLHEILKEHPRTLRTNYVFNWHGEKITNIHKSMVALAIKSNIPWGRKVRNGWTLHDFRHTWVTNARRAGVAESVIMKITGHKTRAMFDRYNFVDEKDAMIAGELLTRLIDSDNTTDDRLA